MSSIIQNFINILRAKENKDCCVGMQETVLFLSQYIGIDKDVKSKILKKRPLKRYFCESDKKCLAEYLEKIDAYSLPKMTGILREHQLSLLEFAKEVCFELEKNDIKPMLIGGTLLGAIRHKGFIPWDDDIDFDVMRSEYEKMWDIAKQNYLCVDTKDITSYNDFYDRLDELVQKNPNTIIWGRKPHGICAYRGTSFENLQVLDFFPRDYIVPTLSEKQYLSYRDKICKQLTRTRSWDKQFEILEKEIHNSDIYAAESTLTAKGLDSFSLFRKRKASFVPTVETMPLSKIPFEDTEFYAMKNPLYYLSNFFGNWKCIPIKLCACIHIKQFNEILKARGRKYYINIDELIKRGN